MQNLDQTLDTIADAQSPVLPKKLFDEVCANGDLSERGKLYDFFLSFGESAFSNGEVASEQLENFFIEYLAACLRFQQGHGDHMGCYEAGWEIARLINTSLRSEKSALARRLISVVDQTYIEGDGERRICIENACVEHVFEDSAAAKFFAQQKISSELQLVCKGVKQRQLLQVPASPFGEA